MKPRLPMGRVLVGGLAFGASLGGVLGLLGWLGVPDYVRMGLFIGAIVATPPVVSWLVRTGRAPWLVRHE